MYTFKEFIELDEQALGRLVRYLGDLIPRRPSPPIVGGRPPRGPRTPKPKPESGFKPDSLVNPGYADEILGMLREVAEQYYNNLPNIFPGLFQLHEDAFLAFRMMLRKIMGTPNSASEAAANSLLDYLYDMDITISWDVDAGRIFFHHTDPAIDQQLQIYMEGILGIVDGLIDIMIDILENGYGNPLP